MSVLDPNVTDWAHWNATEPRVTLQDVRSTVEAQNSLVKQARKGALRGTIRKGSISRKRKERHNRWYPDTSYDLTRLGIPMDESPEALYQRGELREAHLYHWTHVSEEAKRNMKRPKYVGVFRVRAFETADHIHHYVRPQQKYLEQLYGFDKEHPLPEGEPRRTNRALTWTMVRDEETGNETPYHVDIFAIRGQRSQQNSRQRRIRKRSHALESDAIRKKEGL